MKNKCDCVKRWMEKVKRKYNAVYVSSSIPYDTEIISYKRMVVPNELGKPKQMRISKYWYDAESRSFKFCPHCGKKLKGELG